LAGGTAGGVQMNEVKKPEDELRDEYDEGLIRKGVRGKYAERYKAGTNFVLLAPDVAAAFPNDTAVNEALRLLMAVAKQSVRHSQK
jgi:hypothetical protein